jgi:hypothetical protein
LTVDIKSYPELSGDFDGLVPMATVFLRSGGAGLGGGSEVDLLIQVTVY